MLRRIVVALIAFSTLGACTQRSMEQQLLEDTAEALGGRERIEAVTTLTIEGEGEMRNLGQDMTPDATSQTFSISDYVAVADLTTERMRVEQTRTPNFNYFRGRDPMKQVFGVDGDIAYDIAPDGSASRAPDATAKARRAAIYHHPLTLLHAALDPTATLANSRTVGAESLVDITIADSLGFTLAVDAATKLPSYITSTANHPNLRDVTHRTTFADYTDVDGLMLPAAMTASIDDYQILEFAVTAQSVDGDAGDLAAPEAAGSAAPITGPPPANVEAERVVDGVWMLAGQSHHSVLVEFEDHLMLIEAPNEARTLAVIAKARELVPDKPVTHMVSSHHHFDHSGGIRAAISEGLTIVTQAANASFYEELAARASDIAPDTLSQNPQAATIEPVEDEATFEDASMIVQLYHIAGNPHADSLLMAYLPQHQLLVQADAFSPGRSYQPFAANLLESIEQRGLQVQRILPIHGDIVPFEDLKTAVQAMTD